MTVPIYKLHDLGAHAQDMARDRKNERLAMILQSVATGSMIIMAGAAVAHLLRDLFGHTDRQVSMRRLGTYAPGEGARQVRCRLRPPHIRGTAPAATNPGGPMAADYGPQTAGLATTLVIYV